MAEEACCTCASLLYPSTPTYDYKTEKAPPADPPRRLPCCGRAICATCISTNARFASYCPFCQVTSGPSALPQGLRDPPVYTSPRASPKRLASPTDHLPQLPALDEPPAYSALQHHHPAPSSKREHDDDETAAPDVTHHLHAGDTLSSLSLAYAVPLDVLRRHNTIYSDHLLPARRTLSIPGSHYKGGVSLSAAPVESADELERKSKLRRFMVAVKCHEYDVAELYLKQADFELERALDTFREDERWEKENPFEKDGKVKVKAAERRRRGGGGGIAGQV